jgi:hypothetical protein
MNEWWTYRPSDFLMFAPDTYWRQFELHNTTLWPFQLLPLLTLLAMVSVVLLAPAQRHTTVLRWGVAGLAVCWAFVGWAFLWQRYAPINWAAQTFALVFAAQSLGLLGLATRSNLQISTQSGRRVFALSLLTWAALVHPLLALAFGRPLVQAELFGTAPDPTALATLGWLLLADARTRSGRVLLWTLQAVALVWCVISAVTLWTMGSAQGWMLLIAAMLSLGALWRWPYAGPNGP